MIVPWLASILGFLALLGTIIWYAVHNKSVVKADIMPNSDIILNLCKTKFTDGYYLGLEMRRGRVENRNDTFLVSYYPIDKDEGEDVPRPEIQKVVVLRDNLVLLAKGRRNIWMIVSENPDDYPETIRKTKLGEIAIEEGTKAYLKKTFGNAFRELTKVVSDLQTEWSGGEVTAHKLGVLKEFEKKLHDISLKMEEANKKLEGQNG